MNSSSTLNTQKHDMDFIEDKELYKAVMFARKLMREGTPPGKANTIAANHYEYDPSEVAHYTGQVGGACSHKKGIRAKIRDNKIILSGNTYDHKETIKSLGFWWNSEEKFWYTNFTTTTLDKLEEIGVDVEDLREILSIQTDKFVNQLKKKFPGLYNFQAEGVKFGQGKNVLFADEMGLGKTVESITLAQVDNQENLPILIVVPKSVIPQWKDEIKKWSGKDANIIDGKDRIEKYFQKQWTVVNYEKLLVDKEKFSFPSDFFLICDEVSKIKNYKTKIYKYMKEICPLANKVIFLTGTPIENQLADIYNINKLLYPMFMKVPDFRENHCVFKEIRVKGGRIISIVIGHRNLPQFIKKMANFCIRRKRIDVVKELPPLQIVTRFVDLSAAQYEVFQTLINEAQAREKGKFEILQLLRLVADDVRLFNESDSEFVQLLGLTNFSEHEEGTKLKEIKDILDEYDGKVLIFTQFARMARILYKQIPDAVLVTGGFSTKKKEEAIKLFKEEKRILISTETLAYGMNFQFVDTLINYDLPWNPAKLNQRISRIYRIGAERPKLVINLFSKEIEDRVYDVIKIKQELFDKVVEGEAIEDENLRQMLIKKFIS